MDKAVVMILLVSYSLIIDEMKAANMVPYLQDICSLTDLCCQSYISSRWIYFGMRFDLDLGYLSGGG